MFVSAYEDGLQVFDLKDPKHPKTDGAWYTCECEHEHGFGGTPDNGWQSTTSVEQGAFGVDVRNYDGLIVLSDMRTRSLDVQDGRLQRLERPRLRHAEHLERAGLGPRPGQGAKKPRRAARHERGVAAVSLRRRARRASSRALRSSPRRRARSTFRCSTRRRRRTAQGHARLVFAPSPFGVAVTADGHASYDVQIDASGLPDPSTLGAYTAYVAWAVTTDLTQWDRLGAVKNGTEHGGPRGAEQVPARRSPPSRARRRRRTPGPTVLHGTSPSGWLQTFLTHPLFRGVPP